MAYYRKRYKPSRSRKRRSRYRYKRRRYNMRTGGMQRKELKSFQTNVSPTPIARNSWVGEMCYAGTIPGTGTSTFALNSPQPGTGLNQRIGNSIFQKSIHVRGKVVCDYYGLSAALPQQPQIIIALVIDHQANNSTGGITGEDVYEYGTLTPVRQLDDTKRFTVLAKEVFAVPQQTVTGSTATSNVEIARIQVPFEIGAKLKYMSTKFSGVGGTEADITDNKVCFCIASTSTIISDPQGRAPTVEYTSRLRYYD